MNQRARVIDPSARPIRSRTATVIRFPFVLTVRAAGEERRRPSLALNILMIVLLVLACVIWEALSVRHDSSQDLRHGPVTSPRAVNVHGPCCAAV
jgi:hypothetical protein